MWLSSLRRPPLDFTLHLLAFVLMLCLVTSAALGCLVRLTFWSEDFSVYREAPMLSATQDWFTGFVLLHGGLIFAHSGAIDRMFMRLRLAQAPFRFTLALRVCV